jgi:hypothetical protein
LSSTDEKIRQEVFGTLESLVAKPKEVPELSVPDGGHEPRRPGDCDD